MRGNTTQLEDELRAVLRTLASVSTPPGEILSNMPVFYQLTAALPLSDLALWEQFIRSEFGYAYNANVAPRQSGWRALLSTSSLKEKARPDRFLTWIDLVSFDGHVRERTLRTLAGPVPNALLFCLAARRLNDWVPQVRAAAREAVPALARASNPEHVVDALCALLPTWTLWGRAEQPDKQVMAELMSITGVSDLLSRKVIVSSAGPMSTVLTQALRTQLLDDRLMQIAADAVQPAVRARAYRALLTGEAVWVEGERWRWTDVRYCRGRMEKLIGHRTLIQFPPLLESLNAAAADRSSIVRRVAAAALIRKMGTLGADALPLALKFAGDESRSVAERGAFVLQRLALNA